MKNKLKIILPAGLIALALICVIVVRQGDPGTEEGKSQTTTLGAQQTLSAEETPDLAMTAVPPEVTLPPIITPPPKASADSGKEPGGSSAGETVTTEPDGTIVITPDWQAQIDHASKIVTPDSQVTANIGGGGGDMELGKDGAFHGDNPPTATPAPIQTPTPTVRPTPAPVATPPAAATRDPEATPPENTPTAPGGLVKPGTPETTKDPTPEATPSPDPSQGSQEGPGGPPSYNGRYDGEISPDGLYGWIGGFGWIKMGGSDGGTGGQIDDSDRYAPGTGLTGNKVGEM